MIDEKLPKHNKKNYDSIPSRIEFIQKFLKNKDIKSLVNFDNINDEFTNEQIDLNNSMYTQDENVSKCSLDTRIVLQKRFCDFTQTIMQLSEDNDEQLEYITSGSSGHLLKGTVTDKHGIFEYAVKVVAYSNLEKYGTIFDIRRPENAELKMIKLLSYFVIKKQTPHIVLPIAIFDTDLKLFTTQEFTDIAGDSIAFTKFLNKYKKGEYHDNASVLISEWANRGDLGEFLKKYYDTPQFSPKHWKSLFFQIISVLAIIQSKYPTFRHNDLKADNILIQKILKQDSHFKYTIARKKYKVSNIGYQIKLWDFDFSCIPGIVDNIKVEQEWTKKYNISQEQNRYYDIHFFFNTLINMFIPSFMRNDNIPKETHDFISRILPKKYKNSEKINVTKGCRLLTNDEYILPVKILEEDPYFEEFR